jgi:4-coumarate--CoA ligase
MTPPSHSWFEQGTVGLIIEGVEVQILDPDTLEPCEEGEVCIRSESLYTRYYGNTTATERTFLPGKDGKAWLRTGDRGYFDTNSGQLALVGRFNEMITLGTVRIIPSEIEAELLNHPSIADAAITTTALQGFEGPEQCLAYIVRNNESLTATDVHDFVAGRVSTRKAPKSVVFCESIPRNSAIKIMRKSLKELKILPGSMLSGLA